MLDVGAYSLPRETSAACRSQNTRSSTEDWPRASRRAPPDRAARGAARHPGQEHRHGARRLGAGGRAPTRQTSREFVGVGKDAAGVVVLVLVTYCRPIETSDSTSPRPPGRRMAVEQRSARPGRSPAVNGRPRGAASDYRNALIRSPIRPVPADGARSRVPGRSDPCDRVPTTPRPARARRWPRGPLTPGCGGALCPPDTRGVGSCGNRPVRTIAPEIFGQRGHRRIAIGRRFLSALATTGSRSPPQRVAEPRVGRRAARLGEGPAASP